jgi:hypothetical protein
MDEYHREPALFGWKEVLDISVLDAVGPIGINDILGKVPREGDNPGRLAVDLYSPPPDRETAHGGER